LQNVFLMPRPIECGIRWEMFTASSLPTRSTHSVYRGMEK
jgi:hypothetical protein